MQARNQSVTGSTRGFRELLLHRPALSHSHARTSPLRLVGGRLFVRQAILVCSRVA